MSRRRKLRTVMVSILLIAAGVFLQTPALAGTGTCDASSSPATCDITVYFSYPETDDNLENVWKPQFQELSNRLFTATDGQLRLGKITVYIRDESHRSDADIIVGKRSSGMTANAHMGKLGGTGRIYVDYNFSLPNGNADKPWNDSRSVGLILVHEWGHYHFNLGDEYTGQWVPPAKANTWVKGDLGGWDGSNWVTGNGHYGLCRSVTQTSCGLIGTTYENKSIMGGPRALSGGGYPLGFCYDANSHNSGAPDAANDIWLTHQQFYWNLQDNDHDSKDCWTIMRRLKDSDGRDVFSSTPTAYPTALQNAAAIDWTVKPTMSRMMLCIDRSGSMGTEQMNLAKSAARMFVTITGPERDLGSTQQGLKQKADWVGAASFSSSTNLDAALRQVDKWTGGVKADTKSAIAGLSSGGSTAIGSGLQLCLSEHLRVDADPNGGPASGRVIVLLSDGQNNSGSSPTAAANDCKNANVRVYTIGLGDGVDTSLMAGIASTTGGRYLYAGSGWDLISVFLDLFGEFRGGLRDNSSHTVPASAAAVRTISVDSLSDTAEFVLAEQSGDVGLTITSPSGVTYSTDDPNAGVTYVQAEQTKFFRVVDPEPGDWQVTADNNNPSDQDVQLATFISSPLLDVKSGLDSSDYDYSAGETKQLLTCLVSVGPPVGGASVTAEITGPDGTDAGSVMLYDDGLENHGDETPDDGIYSNYYTDTNKYGSGTYTVRFVVVNENGRTVGLPFEDAPDAPDSDSQPVPPFEREESLSFNVTGVPDIQIEDEWARIDRFSVTGLNRNRTPGAAVLLEGEFNGEGIAPDSDGLTLRLTGERGQGQHVFDLPASGFRKTTRGDKYLYSDPQSQVYAAVKPGQGGSTRGRFVLYARRQNFSMDLDEITTELEMGAFDDELEITPTKSVRRNSGLPLGATFRRPKNFYNSAKLMVNSLVLRRDSRRTDRDRLRTVLTYEAPMKLSAMGVLTLTIDNKQIFNLSADGSGGTDQWTRILKDGTKASWSTRKGNENCRIKLDADRRLISVSISRSNLPDTVISDNPTIQLTYTPAGGGSGFDQIVEIGLAGRTLGASGDRQLLSY